MLKHTYQPNRHRFFDSLVAFTASASSLGIAFAAQKDGNAAGYLPNEFVAITGNPAVSGIEFHFYPHAGLSTLAGNGWPTSLILEEHAINASLVVHPINLTGVQGLHGAMLASAFVKYFDDTRLLIEARY